jgi:ubiquitin C-terminal hydrolase
MQGLQNLGSTCAVNSLIQIICRTTYLRNVILNGDIPDGTLSSELKEILDMMHNKNHSLSPNKFITHLYNHFSGIFQRGEQIDVGELWMFLFDKLATELAHNIVNELIVIADNDITINIDTLDNLVLATNTALQQKCQLTMNRFNNNKTSVWLDTSQGILLSIIKCNECDDVNYIFEPFISIPLDITNDETCSVASMFRNYLKSQQCGGDRKCDKCNKYTEYTKSLKIWKMPDVLVFIIKRFSDMNTKNQTPVSINQTLCIKKGSILTDIMQNYTYECTSIALHFGSMFGGHYCAICKVDNKYVLYDDLNVNQISDEQMNKTFERSSDAYMLIYTLRQAS